MNTNTRPADLGAVGDETVTTPTITDHQIRQLADATGIDCADDTLYVVCREAIAAGEGTPERVREIWAEATADAAADREWEARR
jgi:hypothetical protein